MRKIKIGFRPGKIKGTRAKLVAKQRVGLPLISKVKFEAPVRNRVLKLKTKVT